ncbi:GTP-binding protein [Oceanobacillus bengalensis]|uniref:GTP-binding protein n=1 Tax=Oceanobacillus bengalensis TaxID=1435466 RepID=A0A494Z521_9BACI|nr:GTP-binding protein [Oceanobacillus bengalensis]
MEREEQLIRKSYYHTFMDGIQNVHPIKVLGDMFNGQQNEIEDLSAIRYAQGEVYFENKDYETAIFKWQNVTDESFIPWAQKNIADAHGELDLLDVAEDYYKGIETNSDTLKIEVLMQLFLLYRNQEKLDSALHSIKEAVVLNPDYPGVTEKAREYYENERYIGHAVDLAIDEATRAESLQWFAVLQGYVEQGFTNKMEPSALTDALKVLYDVNLPRFEDLAVAIWESYRHGDLYFRWLEEINQLLLEKDLSNTHSWQSLSTQFRETYMSLLSGKHLIKDISSIIPNLLINWVRGSSAADALIASSAVLAWNEKFPSGMESSVVNQAETMLKQHGENDYDSDDVYNLFESIIEWAKDKGMDLGLRFEWVVQQIRESSDFNLMIVGTEAEEQSLISNILLGGEVVDASNLATVIYNDTEKEEILDIRDEGVKQITNVDDFKEHGTDEQTLIRYSMSAPILRENRIALIDTPVLTEQRKSRKGVFPYLHLADSLLFVLNADSPLTSNELEMAVKIKEHAPDLPIHFLLSRTDIDTTVESNEKLTSSIRTYFPTARVLIFPIMDVHDNQLNRIAAFVQSITGGYNKEKERKHKILHYCRELIRLLLEKRIEIENTLHDTIQWNEEVVTKVSGAINQLRDMEEESGQGTKGAYRRIKETLMNNLLNRIPDLLKSCADVIKEDTDFNKIHDKLNDEMNRRVNAYIEEKALPSYRHAIEGWINDREIAFKESQLYLNQMSESFYELYDEKITLHCDFQVLDDWRRDMNRMTRGVMFIEKKAIIMHSTVQVIMKRAGKLFEVLPKNKGLLQSKYKKFIENKDYSVIAEQMTAAFMQQFELFEKSIERDINMFFSSAVEELHATIEEKENKMKEMHTTLSEMREKPEIFRDPLTIYGLKVRQFEWMNSSDERVPELQ